MSREPVTGPKGDKRQALTPTTTHDDGDFVRTAIVIDPSNPDTGSLDVVDANGVRLAQINIFLSRKGDEEAFMVDVIDTDERYGTRRLIWFARGESQSLTMPAEGIIAAVDFRAKKGGQ